MIFRVYVYLPDGITYIYICIYVCFPTYLHRRPVPAERWDAKGCSWIVAELSFYLIGEIGNMILYDYIYTYDTIWLYDFMILWLYMIIYDYIWLYMIIYDYIWLYTHVLFIYMISPPWIIIEFFNCCGWSFIVDNQLILISYLIN